MPVKAVDFESTASTNFAIPAGTAHRVGPDPCPTQASLGKSLGPGVPERGGSKRWLGSTPGGRPLEGVPDSARYALGLGDVAEAGQDAAAEGFQAEGLVRQAQDLAGPSEDDLLIRIEPVDPHGMHTERTGLAAEPEGASTLPE